jgi:Ca2+-binding RTX toxin-like protein
MQVIGTDFDDTFLIDPGAQGWIQIRPGEGEDEIRIEGTTGTVRLDYSDQNDSIFANLKFGIIVDGGQGFDVDRITGSGAVTQLRGTDFDDTIYGGNADETFILRQGDDFVSGGQGIDTVRYDRSGVEAVTVDLGFGTATGIWNGQAFSDTLRNIENVRGSRTENDTLRGSTKDNVIDGRGGNDLIQGKAGNDILFGGDGFDRFLFKDNDGDDYIGDFDALNDREKINLRQVTEITNFADLMANHVSEASGPGFQQTYISDGVGLNITLDGVALADLNAGDFIF